MCPAAASSRWCPTPEQVMILEEMYRSGIRTPNASQIQQITSHLSSYGKIQGKNVFYWFQNHKARDRQKMRRKLTKQLQLQQQLYHPNHHFFPSPAFHNHSFYNSPTLFPQVRIMDDEAAKQAMNYTWKFDIPERSTEKMDDKSMMRNMYGGDLLMMVDVGPPLSSTPPLKTLELFPVKASSCLKEEDLNKNFPPNNLSLKPILTQQNIETNISLSLLSA